MTTTETLEILDVLNALPSDKIVEVKDFAIFLRERYAKTNVIDESDEWSDEDFQDITNASINYVDEATQ